MDSKEWNQKIVDGRWLGERRNDAGVVLVDTRAPKEFHAGTCAARGISIRFRFTTAIRASGASMSSGSSCAGYFRRWESARARPWYFTKTNRGCARRGSVGARIGGPSQGANARRRAEGGGWRENWRQTSRRSRHRIPAQSARGNSSAFRICLNISGVATCKFSMCAATRNISASGCARNMAARFLARCHLDWTAFDCRRWRLQIARGIARTVRSAWAGSCERDCALLPGRLSRGARVLCAQTRGLSEGAQLSGARGANGAIATTCP